ncbi:DinB family protein [Desertivirga xinjiangensis]|uniref:DinB family protein n=1 Tax=Desertivirga xinjiangensis TaxID=539206 RepID=UPI00210DE5FB|nr:DinB family protein [Pedobacter xinjiangensis]
MESNLRASLAVELIELMTKGNAHMSFEEAIADIPPHLRLVTPDKLPYSIWSLVEHIRITQWDIVEFCSSADHVSPKWPDEYWPAPLETLTDSAWENSIDQIISDRERFFELLKDERNNLFHPFEYGTGQHLFREATLIADHASYHIGQIILIRRLLNNWK